MKKNLSLFLVLFLFVFTLSACNNVSENNSSSDNETTSAAIDVNESGVNLDGSIISFANMKIDNPELNLTEDQIEVLKYFDTNYLRVYDYNNFQKYPIAYRQSQVVFLGKVVKVINADDNMFECLFQMERNFLEWGNAQEDENLLIIKGRQQDARLIEGDCIEVSGRFIDVEKYDIDAKSYNIPTVTVNYYTEFFPDGGFYGEKYDLSTISRVAKSMLGNDIKIKKPESGVDFELDELHIPDHLFYLATLDNQSNANFSRFEFYTQFGYVRSSDSSVSKRIYLGISADFKYYILSTYMSDTKMMYLEYYDRDFKKIWGREFTNVDTVPYDYTSNHIYLAADTDFFVIDTATGEDVISPVIVGQKASANAVEDGVILIGTGSKDNIMKVSHEGEIIWKTSVDFNVTACSMLQIVNGNVIVKLRDYSDRSEYKERIVVVDQDGNIAQNFVDEQYIDNPYDD